MNQRILNQLLTIEAYAEQLRQECYRARKTLEGVYPPASTKTGKKVLSDCEVGRLISNRKKVILRKLK